MAAKGLRASTLVTKDGQGQMGIDTDLRMEVGEEDSFTILWISEVQD